METINVKANGGHYEATLRPTEDGIEVYCRAAAAFVPSGYLGTIHEDGGKWTAQDYYSRAMLNAFPDSVLWKGAARNTVVTALVELRLQNFDTDAAKNLAFVIGELENRASFDRAKTLMECVNHDRWYMIEDANWHNHTVFNLYLKRGFVVSENGDFLGALYHGNEVRLEADIADKLRTGIPKPCRLQIERYLEVGPPPPASEMPTSVQMSLF